MHSHKIMAVLAACAPFILPVVAHAQDVQAITVTLTSYAFTPDALILKAGVPARLHLVNATTKGHSFSAPEFFAASAVAPGDRSKAKRGVIELSAGESADLTVTPDKPGTYPLECTRFMHTMMGMKGSIAVQ